MTRGSRSGLRDTRKGGLLGHPASPGRRRAAALMAVAALAVALGLALIAPRPSQAQTGLTMVSNTGQANANFASHFSSDYAMPFTTGAHTGGYKLTSVELANIGFNNPGNSTSAAFTVSIHTGSGTSVGSSVGTLTSSNLTAGTNTFTSSSGIDLDASTSYFVVFDLSSQGNKAPTIRPANSTGEDSGGAAGWAIGDSAAFRVFSSTGGWGPASNVLKMSIKGYAKGLSLGVSPSSLAESADSTEVTVTATVGTAPTSDLTVNLSVDGTSTAASGADYAALGTLDSITISTGQTSGTATVDIDPAEDTIDEMDETIVIAGTTTANKMAANAPVTITDTNTVSSITLSASPSSVDEDDSNTAITITATLGGGLTRTVDTEVTLTSTLGGTAMGGGVDYTAAGLPMTVTIPAGQSSGSATGLMINPTQDTVDEGAKETIIINGTFTGATVTGATIDLDDDDTVSSITLSASPSSVDEDDSNTAITITATLPAGVTRSVATEVTLNSTLGGTATSPDYSHSGLPTKVTIAANSSSGSATGLMIDPADDTIDEGAKETIIINGTFTGATVTGATIDLNDNDDPEITLRATRVGSGSASSVDEGDSATFRIIATRNTADRSTAVNVALAAQATSTATSGTDYTALTSTTITIPINASSANRTLAIATIEDRLDEGAGTTTDPYETIVIGASVSGFTVNPVTFTIIDDDSPSTSITLEVSDNSIGEGETTNTTVTIKAKVNDAAPTQEVTVALSLTGAAVSGTDFVANPGTMNQGVLDSITIPDGQVEGSSTFVIDPTDDNIDEDDETITVNGSATGGLTASDTVNITIVDNDTAAISMSTGTTTSIGEGDGATSVTVTATLNIPRSKSTMVALALSGTATGSGTDYTVPASLPSITIAAGSTTANTSLSITPNDDRLDEGTGETITITGAAAGVTSGSTTITLNDNDATSTAVVVTLVNPSDDSALTSIGESADATSVKVVATLNDAAVKTRTEMALTFAGTAAGDYSSTPDSPKVVFDPGEHEASVNISIHPTHDLVEETDETIIIGLTSSLAVTTDSLSITDDDTPSSVTITLDTTSVREADADDQNTIPNDPNPTTVGVTATIDGGITRLVNTSVALALSGDAASGTDYSVSTLPTVTITAGNSAGTGQITITPLHDTVVEGDETITVGGSATGLTINTADITLTDDDSASTSLTIVATPDLTLTEASGATNVKVRAILDGGTLSSDLTVDLALGGTAVEDTDYDLVDATLPDVTITANQPEGFVNISIDPLEDTIDEGISESFTISGTVGLSGFTVRSGGISISDNDTVSKRITLGVAPASINEDAGATTVTVTATLAGSVTRSAATEVDLTFGGSATLNTDYTAAPDDPKVTIPAESLSGTTTLTITPDNNNRVQGHKSIAVRGALAGFQVSDAEAALRDDELTTPDAIDSLTVQRSSANIVSLTWTAPSSPAPITAYRLQRRDGTGAWHNTRYVDPHIFTVNQTLNYNTSYQWRIFARNSEGESPASNVVNHTTDERPPPPPVRTPPPRPSSPPPSGGSDDGGGGDDGGASPVDPAPDPPASLFTDVEPGSALAADIERAVVLGFVTGTGGGRFEPAKVMTRISMAPPLVRLWQRLGGACSQTAPAPFGDIPADSPAGADVGCLYAAGIVTGATATTYEPEGGVTRAQAASLLVRIWKGTGRQCPDQAPAVFTDVAENNVHRDDISCIYALGVTRGTTATTFSPDLPITRAQAAALAVRLFDAALAVPPSEVAPAPDGEETPDATEPGDQEVLMPPGALTRAQVAAPMVRLWEALGNTCPDAATTPFTDVGADDVHRDDISCLYALGVTRGATATTFSPDGAVTRAQTASLLVRIWKESGRQCPDQAPAVFTDVAESNVHRDDISCLYALGVIRGTSATTYSPERIVTEAEMALLTARIEEAAQTR